MKRFLCMLLCALAVLPSPVCRAASKRMPGSECHWYCRHMGNGEVPPCDGSLAFIREHGGLYVGENLPQKTIFLTFDLGYENGNGAKIASVLEAHHAQAAFFVLSHIVEKNADLIRSLADRGHLICNHTAHHKNMAQVSKETFVSELKALERIYTDTTGFSLAPFYRPPEGSFTEENLDWAQELGYTTVFWSFAYADWDNNRQPDCEKAFLKIVNNTHDGEILLLHPNSATNAAILDRLLTYWEQQGYRFGSLYELVPKREAGEASA